MNINEPQHICETQPSRKRASAGETCEGKMADGVTWGPYFCLI